MLNYMRAYVMRPLAEVALGRDIKRKTDAMHQYELLSPAERQQLLKKKLHSIVSDAKINVPYYSDLFASIQFDPDLLLKSIDYIQEIPLLNKDILREQGERLLNKNLNKEKLHLRKTNGSTGLITDVWYDQEALDWTAAANMFVSEKVGRKKHQNEVMLIPTPQENFSLQKKQIEKLKCWTLNRSLVHAISYTDEGLGNLLSKLTRAKAFSVQGHPSTLYRLAIYAQKNENIKAPLFEIFESTGESINHHQFEVIKNTFGCKIFNRYGNAEIGVLAYSAQNFTELSVLDCLCLPESHSLGNGLEELIVTGLTNSAMPLIRYKTGDVGNVHFTDGVYKITNLFGRVHDIVNINGVDYTTHYIQNILEKVGGVDEFQIVEYKNSTNKTLKIVTSEGANKSLLESTISQKFGPNINVEYTSFDGLLLQGWRDKFRYLIRV